MASSSSPSFTVTQIPPKTGDIDETWAFLAPGVDHIMTRLKQDLSFAAYTSLVTVVYNYCTYIKMHGKRGGGRTGANHKGADLYNKLAEYFTNHCKPIFENVESLQDEALLRYYAAEWDRYSKSAKYLDRLFTFLNRYWVKRVRDEGRKTVYKVYTLAQDQGLIKRGEPDLQRDLGRFVILPRKRTGCDWRLISVGATVQLTEQVQTVKMMGGGKSRACGTPAILSWGG
ncbi:Cullin repeat-like-containing domain protein [Mycena capillaripes]|nr:Cullin repeat-like-containing domain protein [Mycena capillaripes]